LWDSKKDQENYDSVIDISTDISSTTTRGRMMVDCASQQVTRRV
jgi:hypothetical protein